MRYFKRCCLIIANTLLMLIVCIVPASASTITGAFYSGDILISNSSFASANNAVPFKLTTQTLIDSYMIESDCSNTAITDGTGTDIAYMPAQGAGDDWILYVDDIQQNANKAFKLYTGGSDMGGKIRWFPDTAGMTVPDAASLELGNNFEIEIKGLFDVSSGVDKYVTEKADALTTEVTDTGEISTNIIPLNGIDQSQTTSNNSNFTYSTNWFAQVFTPSLSGELTSCTLYLQKIGSPAGDFTVSVRATSGGVPTGADLASCSIACSSISTSASNVTFTFSSPAWITGSTAYALVASCPGGSSTSVCVNWLYYSAERYAGGNRAISYNSGSSWSTSANSDMRFATYMYSYVTSVATGLTSGEHTLKITADGTNLKTYWDGVEKDSDALSGISVPDNSNGWTFCQNGVLLYVEYIKITVGGTLKGYWYWENAATFTDHSGNSNTGTPSFRTATTDADVTASLNSLEPATMAELEGYSTSSPDGLVPTASSEPAVTVDHEAAWAKVPGGAVILSILDVAEIPPALFFMPVMLIVIIIATFITYHFTRDMLFTGLIGNAIIGAFISLSALYVIPLIIGIIAMIVILTKRKTVSV